MARKKRSYSESERVAMEHTLDLLFEPVELGRPTTARPGSEQKVKVLAKRAEKGLMLWHPKDPVLEHPVREPAEWTRGYRGHEHDAHIVDRRA